MGTFGSWWRVNLVSKTSTQLLSLRQSTAEIIELELALNRLGEDSNWDEARLKEKLEQLLEFDVDLSFTGFEQAEIDKILHFEIIGEEEQIGAAQTP